MPTPASEASQPPPVATFAVALSCAADISRQDVLTGEEVEYTLLVTNPNTRHASNVALREIIASGIELLRISATQGAVDVDEQTVTLRFGTLEPGQSALAILDLRVSPAASVGQIFVLRGTAYFDGGAVTCNPVAFAMPPSRLPGTGSSRATP
ncbi:MAG TPA: hypothetical protein PKO09_15475 [Anaerolineae bacterium]|nr:hypothetical protein [Anaerolineae bacterium]